MQSGAESQRSGGAYAGFVLFMLIVVYTFNFIDRQIIGILAGSIEKELGLTDTQLGVMGGLAFAIFYTALGVPIAWLADRANRVWIVTVALALWSAASAACGLTHTFWQLFAARVGVGIGEAGGVAPSYAIISDYFPSEKRGRAMALFSFGIPIGSAFGVLFGGLIAHATDWRMAFLTLGLAGIAVAPIFRLVVREPKRARFDAGASEKSAPLGAVLSEILRKPSFWFLSLGGGASSMAGYGLQFWLPSFYERSLHLSLVDRSLFQAALLFFGGIAGVWLGGALSDRFGAKNKAAYAIVPGVCFLITAPTYVVGVTTNNLWLAFAVLAIPSALALSWLGPVIAAVQHLVDPRGRAVASSVFLLINNLLGLGLGTVFFGWLSDLLKPRFGAESLRYAFLVGIGVYLVAALFMALAARTLNRDWRQAPSTAP